MSEIVDQAFARSETIDKRDLIAFARAGGVSDAWLRRFESLPKRPLTRREVLDRLGEAEQDRGVAPLRKIA